MLNAVINRFFMSIGHYILLTIAIRTFFEVHRRLFYKFDAATMLILNDLYNFQTAKQPIRRSLLARPERIFFKKEHKNRFFFAYVKKMQYLCGGLV